MEAYIGKLFYSF